MDKMTLEKFEEATEAVSRVTLETKLVYSEYYSGVTGNKVYFKPENMQYTGAYKVRGAYYKISTLSEEEREKGLITASAGNHAQGVAYAAKLAGVKATVVMPTTTPLIMIAIGWAMNCLEISSFKLPSDTALVTIIPVAVEISRDGIWPTRPSPTVAMEYVVITSPKLAPPMTIPMIAPPIRLIAEVIRDMTESPLTIFVAPSIEP